MTLAKFRECSCYWLPHHSRISTVNRCTRSVANCRKWSRIRSALFFSSVSTDKESDAIKIAPSLKPQSQCTRTCEWRTDKLILANIKYAQKIMEKIDARFQE
jgi:hypothetical protein